MTYRELYAKMSNWTDEQLDCEVTVQLADEYFVASLRICDEDDDILDGCHPVIEVVCGYWV